MDEPIIANYIEISGETSLFDSLSEEKKQQVRKVLQERLMEAAGYRNANDHSQCGKPSC